MSFSDFFIRRPVGTILISIGILLVGIVASIVIGIVTAIAAAAFGSTFASAATGSVPYGLVALYGLSYVALFLVLGIVRRIYTTQRVWKIVASSVTLLGIEAMDDVAVSGDVANAIGEGLADSLDVAAF